MISLPYDIGQEVFVVRRRHTKVPCDLCKQEGVLIDNESVQYTCPKCGGLKYSTEDDDVHEVADAGAVEKYDVNEHYTWLTAERAWICELADVFPDRTSAQAECDKRNSKES